MNAPLFHLRKLEKVLNTINNINYLQLRQKKLIAGSIIGKIALAVDHLVELESTYQEYFQIAEWENKQYSADEGFQEEQLDLEELFEYFFLEIDHRPQNDPEDGFIDIKILNSDEEDDMHGVS